jgi:hypothetical protein
MGAKIAPTWGPAEVDRLLESNGQYWQTGRKIK